MKPMDLVQCPECDAEVFVTPTDEATPCPECGVDMCLYDSVDEETID